MTNNSSSDMGMKSLGEIMQFNWPFKELTQEELEKHEADRVAAEEKAKANRRFEIAKDRWYKAHIPNRHENREIISHPEWMKAQNQIHELLGNGSIIALLGTRGSGKTQLAIEAIRYGIKEKEKTGLYSKAMEIFLIIREYMRSNEKSERDAIKLYTQPDILVIDAMEVRGETDFENRILDHIIDIRYDQGDDTILISNQKREDFGKSVGASIVSRCHETGAVIECLWESFREAKK